MRVDLHMHSTASDGSFAPEQVVEQARAGRLDLIALADHDTTAGVAAATAAGAALAVEVIPAVEMSSTWQGKDLHILGYFVDPEAPVLLEHAERARTFRESRMVRIIERLAEQGVHVSMDAVRVIAGADEKRKSIGRPHLARALVEAGYVSSMQEAFDRYISDDHDAFVPTALQTPEEAVVRIQEAGGIAVWAHPPREVVDALLPGFVRAGMRGVESFRPNHSREYQEHLEGLARHHGLLCTGGSDWHGTKDGVLGTFWIEATEIAPFLAERGL